MPIIDVVEQDEVKWYVVTMGNAKRKFDKLVEKNYTPVFFCVPDEGYESLSINSARVEKMVRQQQIIIESFEKYYMIEGPH